jgi:uncharacterized protein YbbC (DUF1343 family)
MPIADPPLWMKGAARPALQSASVNRRLRHATPDQRAVSAPCGFFSPQHGFFAEKQDNMIESGDLIDPALGLPVFSLYGHTRVPSRGRARRTRSW